MSRLKTLFSLKRKPTSDPTILYDYINLPYNRFTKKYDLSRYKEEMTQGQLKLNILKSIIRKIEEKITQVQVLRLRHILPIPLSISFICVVAILVVAVLVKDDRILIPVLIVAILGLLGSLGYLFYKVLNRDQHT